MKVGLVIDDRINRPGGVQEYVLGLYGFLKQKGHQPLIFTSGRYTQAEKRKRKIISFGQTIDLPYQAQKGIPLTIGQGKKIKKVLAKQKPEILHIQGFPGPLGLGFLQHSNTINLMTFHVAHEEKITDFIAKPLSLLGKQLDKKLKGKIAISAVAAKYAQKFWPGPYKIIPIGVDTNRFHPKVKPLSQFKDKKLNLLFVGRLDKRKGIDYLLKAFWRFSQVWPEARLIIVGEGSQKNKARDYMRKKELENVVFAGSVSPQALPSYYATADIFCSPATHGESFGVVLLEAMATGLPIVAFDNPGYRALLPKHQQGFLVFNKSTTALAQAFLVLAMNSQLRKELGRKNLKYAQGFSWEKVGKKILAFYQACRIKHKPKA
jgi:phosphatidylinositol alpha-mannosyltransferase